MLLSLGKNGPTSLFKEVRASRISRGKIEKRIKLEARNGILKNLSAQVLGEVRVSFVGWIPSKTIHFVNRRSESFRKFLGRLQIILCS